MIWNIFRKELKDTLRDKRTLRTMLLIPLLVFPIIMNVSSRISASLEEEDNAKPVRIGLVGSSKDELNKTIASLPKVMGRKRIIYFLDTVTLKKQLLRDSIDFGVIGTNSFTTLLKQFKPAPIRVLYNGTDVKSEQRSKNFMENYHEILKQKRYEKLTITSTEIRPLDIFYENIASKKEMLGKLAGGILPYIFIAFGFIGCMYPAIDLFTGEKERQTIETLLTTPIPRWKLLIGKMGVVVISGLTAATCSLIGLYVSINFMGGVKNEAIMNVVNSILTPSFLMLMYGLLIPLTIFFAGVMIPITVRAKSFKEAQSILTPLNIILVLPAMVGFIPGIELNWITASIPVINVVLSTKELIAGTLESAYLIISFIVMSGLAALAVMFSYKQFDSETNILR